MSDNFDGPVPEREDEDDHDLLTYGEVRVRIHEEVVAQRAVVADLEAAGGDSALARRRLDALVDAANRNSRSRINDDNFEKFFGYRGTPRRNT
ncbi:acyl-CoA synthase [Janibacter hoylei]|uniref:Acyl-CoA synthase n=1 Tax=Janibacter indicus TaxID=857417 RepID=A0A1L3MJB8_9MICO|nr:acyl-CoA synthase [Janibacter indicus]APH02438.1 acyl-CoA synthase [Janibacter indicus]